MLFLHYFCVVNFPHIADMFFTWMRLLFVIKQLCLFCFLINRYYCSLGLRIGSFCSWLIGGMCISVSYDIYAFGFIGIIMIDF